MPVTDKSMAYSILKYIDILDLECEAFLDILEAANNIIGIKKYEEVTDTVWLAGEPLNIIRKELNDLIKDKIFKVNIEPYIDDSMIILGEAFKGISYIKNNNKRLVTKIQEKINIQLKIFNHIYSCIMLYINLINIKGGKKNG